MVDILLRTYLVLQYSLIFYSNISEHVRSISISFIICDQPSYLQLGKILNLPKCSLISPHKSCQILSDTAKIFPILSKNDQTLNPWSSHLSQMFWFNLNYILIVTLAVVCKVGVWVARAVGCEVLFHSSLDKVAAQETSLCAHPLP